MNTRLLITLFLVWTSGAFAATITKLPFRITKPGNYTLLKSLRYTGALNAITVESDDVTIDLRGFTISGDPAVAVTTATAGVFADARKNVTIRNGTIRGFFRGVYLEGQDSTGGHLVEHLRVDQSAFLGIQVKGRSSLIRHNRVTTVQSATQLSSQRFGIHLTGSNSRVVENEVHDIVPISESGLIWGIYLENSKCATVERNRVQELIDATTSGVGIGLSNCPASIVQENQVSSFTVGIAITSSLLTKYRDNICTDAATAYSGGTDAGNND